LAWRLRTVGSGGGLPADPPRGFAGPGDVRLLGIGIIGATVDAASLICIGLLDQPAANLTERQASAIKANVRD